MCFSYFFCNKSSQNAVLELKATFIYNFAVLKFMESRLFISAKKLVIGVAMAAGLPPGHVVVEESSKDFLTLESILNLLIQHMVIYHIIYITFVASMSSTLTAT